MLWIDVGHISVACLYLNMIKHAERILFVHLYAELKKMVSRISNEKKYAKQSNYAKT